MYDEFRVGVGVFVFNHTGKFIIGKRKGSYGAGTWSLPGGHLDYGESFEQCAAREVLEETGFVIRLEDMRFLTAINDHLDEDLKHYITIFMGCCLPGSTEVEGDGAIIEPQNLEPDKCEGWEWSSWEDLMADFEDSLPSTDVSQTTRTKTVTTAAVMADSLRRRRMLFLPLRNLLKQRPGLDPLQTYLAAGAKLVKCPTKCI